MHGCYFCDENNLRGQRLYIIDREAVLVSLNIVYFNFKAMKDFLNFILGLAFTQSNYGCNISENKCNDLIQSQERNWDFKCCGKLHSRSDFQ